MFIAAYPSMFTGSLAEPNGGAYVNSNSGKSKIVKCPLIAVAKISIRLSTPFAPTPCAP